MVFLTGEFPLKGIFPQNTHSDQYKYLTRIIILTDHLDLWIKQIFNMDVTSFFL